MERLTEKIDSGYMLKIPKDTELSDLEIKFAAYDKLGVYEDLEKQCIEENQCGLRELLLKWKEFFDDIAELYNYRKAEEQGLLLRFKCKVGDKIYCPAKELNKVVEFTIINIDIYEDEIFYVDDSSNMWDEKEFGTVVFITPEEAESALAEKGGAE